MITIGACQLQKQTLLMMDICHCSRVVLSAKLLSPETAQIAIISVPMSVFDPTHGEIGPMLKNTRIIL